MTEPEQTPEQQQATADAEYEQFYPSTPPRLSDEDERIYATYYPNTGETS